MSSGRRKKIISETSKLLQLLKKVNLDNKKTYSLEQSHRGVSATLKAHIISYKSIKLLQIYNN